MASLTISKLDEGVKAKLRVRAAHHGRSMEEEAREILRRVLVAEDPRAQNLAQAVCRHIEPLGGIELALPQRQPVRKPRVLGNDRSGYKRLSEAPKPSPEETVLRWLAE